MLIIQAECEWQRVNIEHFNSFNLQMQQQMNMQCTCPTPTPNDIRAQQREQAAANAGGGGGSVQLQCLPSLLDHVVEYLHVRGESERWWAEEEVRCRVWTGCRPGGGGSQLIFLWRPAFLAVPYRDQQCGGGGGGNGVKPCGGRTEGWKEGRGGTIVIEGTANCRVRSPDRCDLQEGGGGGGLSTTNQCSHF